MNRATNRLPLLLPCLLAGACIAVREPRAPEDSASSLVRPGDPETVERAFRTPAPTLLEGETWLRLNSGEWLRGSVDALDRETLEFDSEVLEDQRLDWDDVEELLTTRNFTILLADREVVVGRVHLLDGRVLVQGDGAVHEIDKADVVRMVPGRPRESNYWSGGLRVSATARSGNTDQLDTAFSANAMRRTAASRLDLSFDAVRSELEGAENVDNQTFRGKHDLFLSQRLFVTVLGLELFRDPFQNIALRATPSTGLGYTLVDSAGTEGTIGAALGYRYTEFDSVSAGEDDSEETGTLILGTSWDTDLTAKVEMELAYSAQIGLQDVNDTDQDASLLFSTDFAWDFDLDFRIVWKRLGQPAADAGGQTPERDDLRVELGLAWEF